MEILRAVVQVVVMSVEVFQYGERLSDVYLGDGESCCQGIQVSMTINSILRNTKNVDNEEISAENWRGVEGATHARHVSKSWGPLRREPC